MISEEGFLKRAEKKMVLGLTSLNSGLREPLLTFPSSQQEVSVGLILHWKIEDLEVCVGVRFKGIDALF